VRVIGKDFKVDERALQDFRRFLEERKFSYSEEELAAHREELSRRLEEEVLRQVFGEAEARRRSMAWDPFVLKALEVMPKAQLLLEDPQRFVAEREAEGRMAAASSR
jgi:hypothetical protein